MRYNILSTFLGHKGFLDKGFVGTAKISLPNLCLASKWLAYTLTENIKKAYALLYELFSRSWLTLVGVCVTLTYNCFHAYLSQFPASNFMNTNDCIDKKETYKMFPSISCVNSNPCIALKTTGATSSVNL